MFTLPELEAAAEVVGRHMPPTPQHNWPLLSRRAGCEVFVKHENHTPIGAFKVRGGITYMNELRQSGAKIDGVITATLAVVAKRAAAHPDLLTTSSEKRLGIDTVRAAIAEASGLSF